MGCATAFGMTKWQGHKKEPRFLKRHFPFCPGGWRFPSGEPPLWKKLWTDLGFCMMVTAPVRGMHHPAWSECDVGWHDGFVVWLILKINSSKLGWFFQVFAHHVYLVRSSAVHSSLSTRLPHQFVHIIRRLSFFLEKQSQILRKCTEHTSSLKKHIRTLSCGRSLFQLSAEACWVPSHLPARQVRLITDLKISRYFISLLKLTPGPPTSFVCAAYLGQK